MALVTASEAAKGQRENLVVRWAARVVRFGMHIFLVDARLKSDGMRCQRG